MITAEGKCDSKCSTCNIVQQAYCKLVQFRTEEDTKMSERLERIEEAISALDKRLNAELIIAQWGDGAVKVSENLTLNNI